MVTVSPSTATTSPSSRYEAIEIFVPLSICIPSFHTRRTSLIATEPVCTGAAVRGSAAGGGDGNERDASLARALTGSCELLADRADHRGAEPPGGSCRRVHQDQGLGADDAGGAVGCGDCLLPQSGGGNRGGLPGEPVPGRARMRGWAMRPAPGHLGLLSRGSAELRLPGQPARHPEVQPEAPSSHRPTFPSPATR